MMQRSGCLSSQLVICPSLKRYYHELFKDVIRSWSLANITAGNYGEDSKLL